MKTIKRIIRGMGYLEGFGYHPGNWWMLAAIALGAFGGLYRQGVYVGMGGAIQGSFLVTVGMLFPYFYGCYMRTVMYEKEMEKTFNILATKKDVDQNAQSPV
jgi:hypothetical protein